MRKKKFMILMSCLCMIIFVICLKENHLQALLMNRGMEKSIDTCYENIEPFIKTQTEGVEKNTYAVTLKDIDGDAEFEFETIDRSSLYIGNKGSHTIEWSVKKADSDSSVLNGELSSLETTSHTEHQLEKGKYRLYIVSLEGSKLKADVEIR